MEEVFPIDIELYTAPSGKNPFIDWLESLKDRKARAQIKVRLDRVRLGNLGDHKSVGNGVMELRISYGPGYRVYFGRVGKKIILLLCGGDKSTQAKDIKKAKEFWDHFRSQNHE